MAFLYKDHKIEVDSSGNFTAQVGDLEAKAPSLEEAKKQIDKLLLLNVGEVSLKVGVIAAPKKMDRYGLCDYDKAYIVEAEIIGINRTSSEWKFGKLPKDTEVIEPNFAVPATTKRLTILRNYLQRKKEFDTAKEALGKEVLGRPGYGRMEPDKYASTIAKAKLMIELAEKDEGRK